VTIKTEGMLVGEKIIKRATKTKVGIENIGIKGTRNEEPELSGVLLGTEG